MAKVKKVDGAKVQTSFDGKYYDRRKIKSYNKFFMMIISSKGVGKTYQMKEEVLTNYIKRGEKFLYIRRYGTHIKEVQRKGFWKDIQESFPDRKLTMKGDKFYMDDEVIGYNTSVSKAGSTSGVSWHDVTTILFDEFISKGTADDRYIPNECFDFFLIMDNVIRTRTNVNVYLLANNHTIVNPYFDYLGIDVKIGERFTVFPNMIVDMFIGDEFIAEREKTPFGRLMRGVEYGTFSLDNQSLVDTDAFIKSRARSSQFLFNMVNGIERVSIYDDKMTGLIYVGEFVNADAKRTVSLTLEGMSENSQYAKSWRNTRMTELLKYAFDDKIVYYDNQSVKAKVFKMYKKLGI